MTFLLLFFYDLISFFSTGSIYINDCPRQQYIPIYLIVGGCAGVFKTALSLGQRIKNRIERRDTDNIHTNPLDGTLNCFVVCWFIAGCLQPMNVRYTIVM